MPDAKQYDFSDFDEEKKEFDFSDFDEPAEDQTSMLEAGAAGISQGVTLGHADEFTAGLGALYDYLGGKVGARGDIDWKDAYKTRVDAVRKRLDTAQEEHPAPFKTAEIGGAIVPAFVGAGGAAAATGARGLANIVGGGLVAGSGNSTAEIGSKEHLADTAIGGLFGLGTAGLLKGGSAGAKKIASDPLVQKVGSKIASKAGEAKDSIADFLENFAGRRATKAATGQNKKALQEIAASPEGIEGFGKKLLRDEVEMPRRFGEGTKTEKLIGWGDTVDSIADKAKVKAKAAGEEINTVLSAVDEAAPESYSTDELAERLIDYADQNFWQPNNRAIRDKIYKQAEELLDMKRLNLTGDKGRQSAQSLKNSYRFKPKKGLPGPEELQPDVQNTIKKIVGQHMDDTVGAFDSANPNSTGLKQAYQQAKADYGPAIRTADLAEERAIANLSNRFVSPSDHAAGAMGYLKGGSQAILDLAGGLKGAMFAAANNQVRARGNAFFARAADKLARTLAEDPQKLGKYAPMLIGAAKKSPSSAGAVHYALIKNDPNYRNLITFLTEEDEEGGLAAKKGPPE